MPDGLQSTVTMDRWTAIANKYGWTYTIGGGMFASTTRPCWHCAAIADFAQRFFPFGDPTTPCGGGCMAARVQSLSVIYELIMTATNLWGLCAWWP